MIKNNTLQSRFAAAEFLIEHGTEKKITLAFCGKLSGYIENQYAQVNFASKKHRAGTNWLRSDSAFVGVRALRLIERLFKCNKCDRPLTAAEFHTLCNCYFTQYPMDEDMSTNRMHYLIQSIRNGEVLVHDNCSTCHKSFLTHREEAHHRKCSFCL
jgi:hypothetical protein